ncbi:MAG: hypothetical protein K0S20_326, partial [Patescibacteria group bacterium]|nr:hypothetical protein [Patescibacteria group bacterium]
MMHEYGYADFGKEVLKRNILPKLRI